MLSDVGMTEAGKRDCGERAFVTKEHSSAGPDFKKLIINLIILAQIILALSLAEALKDPG